MEHLKCKSCGGKLVVDEKNEYAECEYCHAKYKLSEDLNVNLNLDDSLKEHIELRTEMMKEGREAAKKMRPFIIGWIIFVFCMAIGGAIFMHIKIDKDQKKQDKEYAEQQKINQEKAEQAKKEAEEAQKKAEEEQRKKSINSSFDLFIGIQNKFYLDSLINKVVETNNEYNVNIYINYNNKKYTTEEEMAKLLPLIKSKYQAILRYDENGYVDHIDLSNIQG